MIRKIFLLGTLITLAVLAVAGWFGYQAYEHATAAASIQGRQADVIAKWLLNPDQVKQAGKGRGGVRVPGLDGWQGAGAARASSYQATATSMTVTFDTSPCAETRYTYDIKRISDVVSVIVYVDASWLPDWQGLWRRMTGTAQDCTALAGPATIAVPLSDPLARSAVIDGVSGTSMSREPRN